jgi:hypothetical protein
MMLSPRRAVHAAIWAFALFGIAVYVWLGCQRVVYPLELDFIEGVMMDHLARIAHGQPIYVEPSLRFIPLAYMPFFSVVGGFVMKLTGPTFFAGRIVSLVSSLGTMLLIAGIVRRETRSWTLAVAAPGVYAMAYGLNGAGYDIGRPDSLMLLLTFSGLAVLRYSRGVAGALVAALLLTLGFFSKQHSLFFSFGALAYLFFHDRRRFMPFAVAIVAGCAGGYLLLDLWLGDWFRVFTWSIPSGWSMLSKTRIEHYLGGGVLGALACSAVPALLSLGARDPDAEPGRALWYWAGLASIGTGLLATFDRWAYLHVFTPTVVAFAVLGPIAIDRLGRRLDTADGARAVRASTLALVVLLAQFVPLLYPVGQHRPRPHAREAHAMLLERIRSLPHGAILPYHSWYATEAGSFPSLQHIALFDIERSRGNPITGRDPLFFDRMFAPLHSGPNRPAILTDVPLEKSGPLWKKLALSYRLADSLGDERLALRPLTGDENSVTYVYLPVEPAAADTAK